MKPAFVVGEKPEVKLDLRVDTAVEGHECLKQIRPTQADGSPIDHDEAIRKLNRQHDVGRPIAFGTNPNAATLDEYSPGIS